MEVKLAMTSALPVWRSSAKEAGPTTSRGDKKALGTIEPQGRDKIASVS